MKLRSFRVRTALLSMLVSGIVLGAFSAAAWGWIYRLGLRRIDGDIAEQAGRHLNAPGEPGRWRQLEGALNVLYGDDATGAPILLVTNRAGQALYISPHWPADLDANDLPQPDYASMNRAPPPPGMRPPAGGKGGPPPGPEPMSWGPPPLTRPVFVTGRSAGRTWRLGIVARGDMVLAVGVDMAAFRADMRQNRAALLMALPLALVLIGLGAWVLAQRALRPVEAVAGAAERVSAEGLDQRIPEGEWDTEFRRLVTVFNAMLDRLEASFQQATRFSADAAHELKTPLTILQGELEAAVQDAEVGSDEQRVYSDLLGEVQRLGSIVRKLLLLSLADSGELRLALERVHLTEAVEATVEDTQALAPGLTVTAELAQDVWVMADPDLLQQVLSNLSSNAVKYNREGGEVKFELTADGRAELRIANTGPGIPPEGREKVFERFYRADPSRGRAADGVGLGLSLAREIVRGHKGELVVEEGQEGWTVFRMAMPPAEGEDEDG